LLAAKRLPVSMPAQLVNRALAWWDRAARSRHFRRHKHEAGFILLLECPPHGEFAGVEVEFAPLKFK